MRYVSKTIAALFCILLAASPAGSGSMLLTGVGPPPAASGGSCTPGTQATNFLARTSGLSTPETNATCFLINDLVTAGVITGNLTGAAGCGTGAGIIEGFYFLATKDKTTAYLNICGTSFGGTETATVTCTVDVGCAGDGTSGKIDTGWVPSTNCVNCTVNSLSVGAYVQTTTGVNNAVVIGAASSGAFSFIAPFITGNTFEYTINAATFPTFSNSNTQGAWAVSRTTSTVTNVYKNGSTTPAGTAGDTAVSLPTFSMYLLALNNLGTPSNWSNYQTSCAWFGPGMTAAQSVAINNACNHAMTTLGANHVY